MACLLVSAGLATLHQAFSIAEGAGLGRLRERFPGAAGRISRWENRWERLRAALLLSHALTQAGALAFAAAPLFRQGPGIGSALFFVVIALVSAVALDLLPRALSESYADRLSVRFLPLAAALAFVWAPLARPLGGMERRLSRFLLTHAAGSDRPSAEDAIISLVRQERNELAESEREMIRGVFELSATIVREIMTPRVDVVALDERTSIREGLLRVADHKYSRYPVIRGGLDTVVGIVHVKDLALAALQGRGDEPLGDLAKEALYVAEMMRVGDLLSLMRARREHLAIVADEYGGMAGLATMEDVIEEVVGEIRDEFDEDERDMPSPAGGVAVVDARLSIEQLNETFGAAVPEADAYDTVGGYLASRLGRIPRKGDVVDAPGVRLTVESATARRALRVRVERPDSSRSSDP